MIKVRKTTINLVCGILIGMFISGVSDTVSPKGVPNQKPPPAAATTITVPDETINASDLFHEEIAPGLQIIQVPPPLDINGLHPYQCYFNGQSISIPKEVVAEILASREDPTRVDPNFNIHDFTENLKMVKGRTRSVTGE